MRHYSRLFITVYLDNVEHYAKKFYHLAHNLLLLCLNMLIVTCMIIYCTVYYSSMRVILINWSYIFRLWAMNCYCFRSCENLPSLLLLYHKPWLYFKYYRYYKLINEQFYKWKIDIFTISRISKIKYFKVFKNINSIGNS